MELPLSQLNFSGTLLLLVMSNLLQWEKATSILTCHTEDGGCMEPLVETFNNAINKAETIHNLVHQLHEEFFYNEFSSSQFSIIVDRVHKRDQTAFTAKISCHSNTTNPTASGTEQTNIKTKRYIKIIINSVGAWISPLYHLVIELSAMEGVPETILSKANEMEENNREILDDLRWILTKAYPKTKKKENFPSWNYLPFLKSNDKYYKFLAMYNLSNCLKTSISHTTHHLRVLKCQVTRKGC
ncbi:prolactin-8A9-like [Psammomys obesus]|uniref:prolactin-8A9-like n=1 Tax=Psammomys obesus TaxID=48139 RepID=UPI002452D90A|nr:prolactin-8A9-like [Psammomys obesus]